MVELEETDKINLQFEKRGGLLPVAVQEYTTGQLLMIASTNKEAFDYTLDRGIAAFFSTSRSKLWIKGESSGNYLQIVNILVDCDQDALLYQVKLVNGGVCHTLNKYGKNRKACFYRMINEKNTFCFLEP